MVLNKVGISSGGCETLLDSIEGGKKFGGTEQEVRFLRIRHRKIKTLNLLRRIESLNAYNLQLTNNKKKSKGIKGDRKEEFFGF